MYNVETFKIKRAGSSHTMTYYDLNVNNVLKHYAKKKKKSLARVNQKTIRLG